jgi:hypothetical protein
VGDAPGKDVVGVHDGLAGIGGGGVTGPGELERGLFRGTKIAKNLNAFGIKIFYLTSRISKFECDNRIYGIHHASLQTTSAQ